MNTDTWTQNDWAYWNEASTAAKRDILATQTYEAMKWRGHDPSGRNGEVIIDDHTIRLTCDDCEMTAYADSKPPPNGVDISGEAVALNCTSN